MSSDLLRRTQYIFFNDVAKENENVIVMAWEIFTFDYFIFPIVQYHIK